MTALISTRVLLIDPEPGDRALAAAMLRDGHSHLAAEHPLGPLVVREVGEAVQFAEAMAESSWQLAVSELDLGWGQGSDLLAAIKRRHPDCLTVLFTRSPLPEPAAPRAAVPAGNAPPGVAPADATPREAAPTFGWQFDGYLRKDGSGFLDLARVLHRALAAAGRGQEEEETGRCTAAPPAQAATEHRHEPAPASAGRQREEAASTGIPPRPPGSVPSPGEPADAPRQADVPSGSRPVAVRDALHDALRSLRADIARTGARFQVSPLPVLDVERRDLARLLRELVDNAVRFRGSRPPVVRIRAEAQRRGWLISVQDNGRGMDEATRRLACSPSPATIGSGLVICDTIAQRYGGELWISSSPGHGTTCFVFLRVDSTRDAVPAADGVPSHLQVVPGIRSAPPSGR